MGTTQPEHDPGSAGALAQASAPDDRDRQKLWATVEYDGTDFYGFQIQAKQRTVQGELERALGKVTQTPTRVIGAGRTDRGVHAQGQVVGFEVVWRHSLADLYRAANAVLASDVAIRNLGLATKDFHPRFSAVRRAYRYTLLHRSGRSPLARRSTWQVACRPCLGSMREASQYLVGTHDFGTFGRPPQAERSQNTVRTLFRAEWSEKGDRFLFDIEANAFLYRMVRSIVGMLVLVGWGQISPGEFREILQARDRSQIRQVAPAQGLCLMRVLYDTREGVLQ